MKKLAVFISFLLVLAACTKVPITGRSQMNLLPEADLITMSSEEYKKFLANADLVTDGEQYELVQEVGKKMITATESFIKAEGHEERLANFDWEINLVESEQLNAWCMPGGKICFYTGILDVTKDADGLAVVMGHEIAHAIARHGNERMSKQSMVNLGGQALSVAVSQKSEAARYLLLNAYGVGAQVGVVLPFSRKHELEADKMGLVFMQKAGYNATSSIDFWKRMSAQGGEVPEFLSTHPNDEKRAEAIKAYIESEEFKKYTQ